MARKNKNNGKSKTTTPPPTTSTDVHPHIEPPPVPPRKSSYAQHHDETSNIHDTKPVNVDDISRVSTKSAETPAEYQDSGPRPEIAVITTTTSAHSPVQTDDIQRSHSTVSHTSTNPFEYEPGDVQRVDNQNNQGVDNRNNQPIDHHNNQQVAYHNDDKHLELHNPNHDKRMETHNNVTTHVGPHHDEHHDTRIDPHHDDHVIELSASRPRSGNNNNNHDNSITREVQVIKEVVVEKDANEGAANRNCQVWYPFFYGMLMVTSVIMALIPRWENASKNKFRSLRPLGLTALALATILFLLTTTHSFMLLISGRSRHHNSRKTQSVTKMAFLILTTVLTACCTIFFVVMFLIMLFSFDEFHKVVNLVSAITWWCSLIVSAPLLVWLNLRAGWDLIQMKRRPEAHVK